MTITGFLILGAMEAFIFVPLMPILIENFETAIDLPPRDKTIAKSRSLSSGDFLRHKGSSLARARSFT